MRSTSLSLLILASIVLLPSLAQAAPVAATPRYRGEWGTLPPAFDLNDPPVSFSLALDGGSAGLGASAALRFRHVEVGGGVSTLLFHRDLGYAVVRAILFPNKRFTPYLFGRVGSYSATEGPFGNTYVEAGTFYAGGAGVNLRVTSHFFLFAEGGKGERLHDQTSQSFTDLRFGLGARF
jgi:hypothetical protein